MEALINRTRPFSFIDSDCLRSSIYLYIQSPVFIYLHFLCLPTFLYLFTFSHSYSYLFITPPLFIYIREGQINVRSERSDDKIFSRGETMLGRDQGLETLLLNRSPRARGEKAAAVPF